MLSDNALEPPPERGSLRVALLEPSSADANLDVPVSSATGGSSDDLAIEVRSEGSGDLVRVAGEVDLATSPALHEVVRHLLAVGRRHVSVDLGAVTFFDATALTFLLAAGRDLAAAGGSLTILGHNPLLTRLLVVAGLTGVLDN